VLLLICLSALAQPKPRIDFDRLLEALPDLPWDFEIRYVVQNGQNTDMLRIHYDGHVDLVRWRLDYPGSLAFVCNSSLDETAMRRLLELFRDKKFNDLPTDNRTVVTVANRGEETISVRLGKLIVRKVDRGQKENATLKEIENALDAIKTTVAADPKSKCEMESVPAKP
jgi:hypothetical protein